jgi:hypothetical protein
MSSLIIALDKDIKPPTSLLAVEMIHYWAQLKSVHRAI